MASLAALRKVMSVCAMRSGVTEREHVTYKVIDLLLLSPLVLRGCPSELGGDTGPAREEEGRDWQQRARQRQHGRDGVTEPSLMAYRRVRSPLLMLQLERAR